MASVHGPLLQAIRQFIPLALAEESTVETLFEPYYLNTGNYFLRAGDVCQHVGFINQGLLRYYLLEDGEEHTYDFSAEHSFTCNYESFLQKTPSTRSIKAVEPTSLVRITHHNLQTFYQQVEHGQLFGRLIAEQLFVMMLQKLTAFYQETADERYENFLHLYPGLADRLPQYVVASYVGIKPRSLSRIRAHRAGKQY